MKKGSLKRYFLAGLLVLVPVWVTFVVIEFLINKFDRVMSLLPINYQPDTILGFHIPGLGLVVVLIIVICTGVMTTNFVGDYLLKVWERVLSKIPLVRSIYASVKKILDTMLAPNGQSFRKVLLIEYPRKGSWSLAFQTGSGLSEAREKVGKDMVTVFVPTTPNPTGGFLMLIPNDEVIELDMSVDDAFKLIISLGVILPEATVAKLTAEKSATIN